MNNIKGQLLQIEYAVNKLRIFLAAKGNKAVIITRRNLFSYVTGGEVNIINMASEYANAIVILTELNKIITYSIGDAGTLNHELLQTAGFQLIPYRYFDALDIRKYLSDLSGTDKILSDQPGLFENGYKELLALTRPCTSYEKETYHNLGSLCGKALSVICNEITQNMTELEAQALACREFMNAGLQPEVFLVGNWQRIKNTRHFMSTIQPVGRRVMLIACIRYRGLVLSFTRDLFFRPMEQEEYDLCYKMAYLSSLMQADTITGKSDDQLYQDYYNAFCKVGLKDEFYEHPSAGYTGYEARTSWITKTSNLILQDFDAIALNPCINGYKSEDTFIMENNMPQRINIGIWPEVAFDIKNKIIERPMPLILV